MRLIQQSYNLSTVMDTNPEVKKGRRAIKTECHLHEARYHTQSSGIDAQLTRQSASRMKYTRTHINPSSRRTLWWIKFWLSDIAETDKEWAHCLLEDHIRIGRCDLRLIQQSYNLSTVMDTNPEVKKGRRAIKTECHLHEARYHTQSSGIDAQLTRQSASRMKYTRTHINPSSRRTLWWIKFWLSDIVETDKASDFCGLVDAANASALISGPKWTCLSAKGCASAS